jgi:AcrR family transcriptional regulator
MASAQVILDATAALLPEVGYPALSIEAFARRAGISKSTAYRRWRG